MRSKVVFIILFLFSTGFFYANSNASNVINIPFQKVGNLILIEAEVHGLKGQYVLDTGTPTLWLNEKYFKDASGLYATHQVACINGRSHQMAMLPTDILLPGINKGVDALVVDLSHIEINKGVKVMGLIGQSVFKNYELLFDLPNYLIQLIPIDRKGNRLVNLDKVHSNEIPFKMNGHLPVFPIEINGQVLNIAFDSGAECNVVAPRFAKAITQGVQWSRAANVATGWETQQTTAFRIPGMKVGFWECMPMLTVFSPLYAINNNLPGSDIDGLIGLELMLQQKVSVNFRNKTFYIWGDEQGVRNSLVDKN